MAQIVENLLPVMQETQVQSLGREDPLEKGMATHSSILAWSLILKDIDQDYPNKETQAQPERVPNAELSHPLFVELGFVTFQLIAVFTSRQALLSLVSREYIGVSLWWHDSLSPSTWPMIQSPAFLLFSGLGCLKAPPL